MKLFQSIKISRNNFFLLLTLLFGSFLYYLLLNENINVESTTYLSSNFKTYFNNANNKQYDESLTTINQTNQTTKIYTSNPLNKSEICPIIPPNLGNFIYFII